MLLFHNNDLCIEMLFKNIYVDDNSGVCYDKTLNYYRIGTFLNIRIIQKEEENG
jgi:hypothetical protein